MRARACVSFTPSSAAAVLLLLLFIVVVVEGHCRRRRRRLCPAREFVYSGCTRSTADATHSSGQYHVGKTYPARAQTMVRRGRD